MAPAVEFEKVDLSDFENRKAEVSEQLARAAKSIGFFYVTGAQRALLLRWVRNVW